MKNKGQKNGLNVAPLWLVYAAALKRIPIWTEPSEEIAWRSFKELYFTINGRKNKRRVFFVFELTQTVQCLAQEKKKRPIRRSGWALSVVLK